MKLSSRKLNRHNRVELAMTSMIDVVFLLLIFFMTTASFVKTERQLDTNIKSQESSSSVASDLEPAIVEVVNVEGVFLYRVGGRTLQTPVELTDLLRQFPSKVDGAYVKVSNDVPFRLAAAAIQACKDAGFSLVSYVPAS
jgi:biopolymer transport protein ExbD